MEKPLISLIFVFGLPGSGKDTQIDRFTRTHPEAIKVYPGDMLRKASDPTDPLFNRFNHIIKQHENAVPTGSYVPGEVMFPFVDYATRSALGQGKNIILFSGYPNTLSLLRDSADTLRDGLHIDGFETQSLFLLVAIDEEKSLDRALGRGLKEGEARIDDKRQTVEQRIKNFNETVPFVIEEIKKRQTEGLTSFQSLDGRGNESEVAIIFEQTISDFISDNEARRGMKTESQEQLPQ